jgi:hypothetical protein
MRSGSISLRRVEDASAGDDPEEAPHLGVQSKHKLMKVMFLCAQGRPSHDYHRQAMWDGKIGIWPFGYIGAAARSSVNRPAAGAPVWIDVSVDREEHRAMFINNVLPAITSE